METGEVAKTIEGEKLYQERARKAFPILVRQALANQPIFYSDLAHELDMPNPRNLNFVLGSIGHTLQNVSIEWNEKIPPINCLVINKVTRLPGEGISSFITDKDSFAKLPRKQQRAIVDMELHKIYTYPRWHDVLKHLRLEYKENRDYSPLLKAVSNQHHGIGESQHHKQFKEFVSKNPQILGLPKSVGIGEVEKKLPSGDIVDVSFVHGKDWIIAEVKSNISDTTDIYRGLYQCVKYQAVAEAFQTEKGYQPSCRVVLVLESVFPVELIELKNLLGIEVIEKAVL
ncbi:hypothetical protein KC799_20885 [candidate division KSB1 bacterium]|nr:hypothetical protein [candidate division KSB1 bacterium]